MKYKFVKWYTQSWCTEVEADSLEEAKEKMNDGEWEEETPLEWDDTHAYEWDDEIEEYERIFED